MFTIVSGPTVLIVCTAQNVFSVLVAFFFHATPTTEIYTLSLHDALPIFNCPSCGEAIVIPGAEPLIPAAGADSRRSEEHTSELQSPDHLVCRLLLEKKKGESEMRDIG